MEVALARAAAAAVLLEPLEGADPGLGLRDARRVEVALVARLRVLDPDLAPVRVRTLGDEAHDGPRPERDRALQGRAALVLVVLEGAHLEHEEAPPLRPHLAALLHEPPGGALAGQRQPVQRHGHVRDAARAGAREAAHGRGAARVLCLCGSQPGLPQPIMSTGTIRMDLRVQVIAAGGAWDRLQHR